MCHKNELKIAKKRKKAYLHRKIFSFENVRMFEYI